MECLIDIAQSKDSDESAKRQVMQFMSTLIKYPPKECTQELIKLNEIENVCDVFSKNAKITGVVIPGLDLLTNITKVEEGKKILQKDGLGVKLCARLITMQYPTQEALQKGKTIITKIATDDDLEEALSGLIPEAADIKKLVLLSSLILDEEFLDKATQKVISLL